MLLFHLHLYLFLRCILLHLRFLLKYFQIFQVPMLTFLQQASLHILRKLLRHFHLTHCEKLPVLILFSGADANIAKNISCQINSSVLHSCDQPIPYFIACSVHSRNGRRPAASRQDKKKELFSSTRPAACLGPGIRRQENSQEKKYL